MKNLRDESTQCEKKPLQYQLRYLPKVLRHVVLQFALHQMTKQRLHLIEDALLRLISVVLDGQESLRNTHSMNSMSGHCQLSGLVWPLVTAAGNCTAHDVPPGGQVACRAAETRRSCSKWLRHS